MNDILYMVIPLAAGLLLDAVAGDPAWLPHPVRGFGKVVELMDRNFNRGSGKKMKGLLVTGFLLFLTGALFFGLIELVRPQPTLYYPVAALLVFYGLAHRSLIQEALKVIKKLDTEGLPVGRKQLSRIVGRDTSKLSDNQVRIAVMETLSENLSDGVIAPLLYYFIGGIPLMFVYKMVNTLDSMIGYKDTRYKDFGWFAARLDDMLNYIPARITAFLIAITGFSRRGLKFIFRYGNKHSSPNAGYPEAALAGVVNCRFGGPNYYHDQLVIKPYIGEKGKIISNKDLYKTIRINILVTLIFALLWILILIAI